MSWFSIFIKQSVAYNYGHNWSI